MANGPIIRNYVVTDEKSAEAAHQASTPRIIKHSHVEQESRTLESQKKGEAKQPQIVAHKDAHGIITDIEVRCSCGETFTIKLEYE